MIFTLLYYNKVETGTYLLHIQSNLLGKWNIGKIRIDLITHYLFVWVKLFPPNLIMQVPCMIKYFKHYVSH